MIYKSGYRHLATMLPYAALPPPSPWLHAAAAALLPTLAMMPPMPPPSSPHSGELQLGDGTNKSGHQSPSFVA